jgi:hypothetical protein
VLSDLSDLPEQPSVVVEGPQILPDMLPVDAPAVFLVPTPAFQRRVLTARPMPSRNPDRALAARLVKDRLYADRIASLARERGFRVLEIDGGQPLREVEAQLVRGLAGSEPRDLEAVRRWENENKARNVSAWIASGDLRGAEALPVPFACECGALGCDRDVELTLAEFESERDRPVVADRHRA